MPTSATPYPPPPAFYALYASDATEPAPAPPPTPAPGTTYAGFGAEHSARDWRELFSAADFIHPDVVDPDADVRDELVALIDAACERYVDALRACVDAPGSVEKSARDVGAILNNAHRTINERVRVAQARNDLEYRMTVMIDEKRKAMETLRAAIAQARETRETREGGDAASPRSPGRRKRG